MPCRTLMLSRFPLTHLQVHTDHRPAISTLLHSQASEDGPQSAPVQKTTLEQSSQPDAETQKKIAAMDEAPQSAAVAQNAQTVPFAVFGQTQEAINGVILYLTHLLSQTTLGRRCRAALPCQALVTIPTAQMGKP